MADQASTLQHHRTVFDGWRSISLSLYMTLTGYAVLVGVPVISSAWVNLLGFSEVEVGRVAGADLGGLSLGALIAALLVAKINRRLLVLVSIVIAVTANWLCTVMVDYEQVLWLRLLAGFGSGIYTAVAVCSLGATSKPARQPVQRNQSRSYTSMSMKRKLRDSSSTSRSSNKELPQWRIRQVLCNTTVPFLTDGAPYLSPCI